MVILTDGEIYWRLLRYGLALIGVGWLCFRVLFPMIGQWCCDLCKRLEDANKKMEQEQEKVLGQQVQPEQEQDDDRPICAPWLGQPK